MCLHLHLPHLSRYHDGTLLLTNHLLLTTPQVPWDGYTPADIKAKVVEGQRPRTERTMPRACDGLLRKAWHQDAKMRPTFEQARPTPPPSARPPARARRRLRAERAFISCSLATARQVIVTLRQVEEALPRGTSALLGGSIDDMDDFAALR